MAKAYRRHQHNTGSGEARDADGYPGQSRTVRGWIVSKGKGHDMRKYDLSQIMTKAWKLFRELSICFSEALHRAWISAKARTINESRIARAKAAAGISEETATWSDWRKAGFEVRHGSKSLFGCDLIYGSKGDGAIYKARFFGASQVEPIAATT